jgi:hypothetical protein
VTLDDKVMALKHEMGIPEYETNKFNVFNFSKLNLPSGSELLVGDTQTNRQTDW